MAVFSFARVTYSTSNLGDDIQTLAALSFMSSPAVPFDRDTLALQKSEQKYILIMNGWWAADPENAFPPADCFTPVFVGFHIAERYTQYFMSEKCIDYFRKHQPIGCRDTYTQSLLMERGIDTFFSGCLTATFEKRNFDPEADSVYLVDTERIDHLIPRRISKNAIRLTHHFSGSKDERENVVRDLMRHYKNKATLVITTRLHVALPCSAVGIPVVLFFYPSDPRASTASQIGLKMYTPFLIRPDVIKKILAVTHTTKLWTWYERATLWIRYRIFEKINWSPAPLEFEEHKIALRAKVVQMIKNKLGE